MKIALIGAGRKMGLRLARNLEGTRYNVAHVEVSDAGRQRLRAEVGSDCVGLDEAFERAKAVVLAVPDTAIQAVSNSIVDKLASGTILIALDAAAPFAGHFPKREDVTFFVTHPCHPPIFNDETEPSAKRDCFGGVATKKAIVRALIQGPEEDFAVGEEIAKTIFRPILRSHRITVEKMALLEPGLFETVCATLLVTSKDTLDEVVRLGADQQAARDFLIGQLNTLGAAVLGEVHGIFSDACIKAIANGKTRLMRDDWLGGFMPEEMRRTSGRSPDWSACVQ